MTRALQFTSARITRRVAVAVLVVIAVAEMVLLLHPAHADTGSTIEFNVAKPLSVDETSALVSEPITHKTAGLNTGPMECSLVPMCRFFVFNLSYPDGVSPDTTYYTTITAHLHGSGSYQLNLYADPTGNASEVAGDASGSSVPSVHLVTTPDDPDQQYGLTMWYTGGVTTPFTLTFDSSTQAFPNPFESLNPVPTIPSEIPPPVDLSAVTTTLPPAQTAPVTIATPTYVPPPQTSPDVQLTGNVFTDTSNFNSALAPPVDLFKKAAAVGPPGKPSDLQLWLALLALPVAILLVFPILIRRYRAGGGI